MNNSNISHNCRGGECLPNIKKGTYVTRQSGIELIKIFAILLIVFSHLTQTLGYEPESYNYGSKYWIDFWRASTDLQTIGLALFQHCGSTGNLIFLISSCWFLCSKTNFKGEKVFTMLLNVWTISVLILVISLIFGINVSTKTIIKCFIPNFLCTNWFITCYILLYISHPVLNTVLSSYSQKQHLTIVSVLFGLYFLLGFIKPNNLFISPLIIFYTVYFTVAYVKFYLKDLVNNKKTILFMLIVGGLGIIVPCLALEFLSLYFNFFSEKVLRWCNNQNIFIFLFAIGTFCLAKKLTFHSNFINRLSSLSLLVYVIHENLLVRERLRPFIYENIYVNYNELYDYILIVMICLSLLFFVCSYFAAFIYAETFQKIVIIFANKISSKFETAANKIADSIIKIR